MTEAKTTTARSRAKKAEAPEEGKIDEPAQAGPSATPDAALTIFEHINLISKEAGALAPEAKGGVPFAFRGIDGTVAHLSYFLNKYGVFAAPKVLSHIVLDREVMDRNGNPSGRVVKTTQVEVEYTFYGPAGDSVSVVTPGLADDFADRSSAQAMSVAYRIALLQLFHLPTHTREPEETGEDVIATRAAVANTAPAVAQRATAASAGPAPATSIGQLQAKAKALGGNLGIESDDLNAMGSRISNGADPGVWFNDPAVMSALVAELEAGRAAGVASTVNAEREASK